MPSTKWRAFVAAISSLAVALLVSAGLVGVISTASATTKTYATVDISGVAATPVVDGQTVTVHFKVTQPTLQGDVGANIFLTPALQQNGTGRDFRLSVANVPYGTYTLLVNVGQVGGGKDWNDRAEIPIEVVAPPADSDKDGVPDSLDKCPGTPAGTKVDARGCPIVVATTSYEVGNVQTTSSGFTLVLTARHDSKVGKVHTMEVTVGTSHCVATWTPTKADYTLTLTMKCGGSQTSGPATGKVYVGGYQVGNPVNFTVPAQPTGGACLSQTGSVKTTTSDGGVVNENHYTNKTDVYVSGSQLGNVSKVYVRITDPSGTVVLSSTAQVTVTNGAFGPVRVPSFGDTPNPGGEYKVWVSSSMTFENKCTKTDNFKVVKTSPSPSSTTTTGTPTSTSTTTAPPTSSSSTTSTGTPSSTTTTGTPTTTSSSPTSSNSSTTTSRPSVTTTTPTGANEPSLRPAPVVSNQCPSGYHFDRLSPGGGMCHVNQLERGNDGATALIAAPLHRTEQMMG